MPAAHPQPTHTAPADRRTLYILIGLITGVVLGLLGYALGQLQPTAKSSVEWAAKNLLDPFGQIFLRLLFIVIVPLVFASLAQGVAQLGNLARLGPMAARTFALFAINMIIGVSLGLLIMNIFQPGQTLDAASRDQLLSAARETASMPTATTNPGDSVNLNLLVEMFLPRNLLQAIVNFQLLPLILFSLLVGAATTYLPDHQKNWVETGLQTIVDLMARIVDWAMNLAPYAVTALVASAVAQAGWSILQTLLLFVTLVILTMAFHLTVSLSLLMKLFSKRSPKALFRGIRIIMATAFSTSSSSATLPTSIHVSRNVLGVSHATSGFVLPLGATLNMSGTALYEGCVVLFVAQVYDLSLGIIPQIQLVLLAVLGAVAVAGVPGGSLPVMMGLLSNFGLPAEGILLILGFDRILDMARTTVNVSADVVTACIVDDHLGNGTPPPTDARSPASP
jgi:Na+/H+-dicarboxylate symporter